MVNNNDGQKDPVTNESLHNKEPKNTGVKSHCNSAFKMLSGISLLFAVIAIFFSLYNFQHTKAEQRNIINNGDIFSKQLSQLKQGQEHVEQLVADTVKDTQEAKLQLQTNLDNLNKSIQQRFNEQSNTNQDWLLLKTRYFLELAQINAHWTDNYATTIALLQEADRLLQTINETQVLNIRQAIAKDIATLKAIPTIDLTGLLSQIDSVQHGVSQLKMQVSLEPINQKTTSSSPTESTWRTQIKHSVDVLQKLVVIRRHDEDIQPLLSPMYAALVKESIHLNLQEAQWAVLTKNQDVFNLSLKQAINQVKIIANESNKDAAAIISTLTELQKTKFSTEKPDIGQAIPLLNQLIKDKNLSSQKDNKASKGAQS